MSRGTAPLTPKIEKPPIPERRAVAAFGLGIGGFTVFLAHPAGFEPTAYRLGVPKSVRL